MSPARIEAATRLIDPVFLNTPQYVDETLCRALGRQLLVKVETANRHDEGHPKEGDKSDDEAHNRDM